MLVFGYYSKLPEHFTTVQQIYSLMHTYVWTVPQFSFIFSMFKTASLKHKFPLSLSIARIIIWSVQTHDTEKKNPWFNVQTTEPWKALKVTTFSSVPKWHKSDPLTGVSAWNEGDVRKITLRSFFLRPLRVCKDERPNCETNGPSVI